MKIHKKFLVIGFLKSFFNVFVVMTSIVFILNILQEIEFFSNKDVNSFYPIYLSIMSSPSIIFEMFPFILLITTQLLFIKLFENKELDIFKYSGLKNTKILIITSVLSFITGLFIVSIFYNLSSNFKNFYLELKSNYADDGKYLAVVTNNGLWIKDKVNDKIIITNSSSVNEKFLVNNFSYILVFL